MTHIVSRLASAATLALLVATAPAAAIDLPFGWGQQQERAAPAQNAPVLMAQSSDASLRISQMEEEMRRLVGRVEEMSFLVLQLQEQLRNAQEDNELRFQDLEGGSSGAATTPERRSETPAAPSSGDQEFALGLPPITPPTSATSPAPTQSDEIGAILGSAAAAGAPPAASASSAPSQTVASISTSGPIEMYTLAYNYLLAGDYQLAESTFRQYADTYPDSAEAADARYWLGESLFAQNRYRDAAEVFLNAQKSHPESGKAPEMMLKLGMSLARLENRDTACVTYAEVERRYPQMSENVRRKLGEEERAASCS